MIINSVRLNNIRSYLDQEVHFPRGSVLLSGDIGAGKSTILLAIEFALFGILSGSLEGEALLRNGKNTGFVELNFTVDDKHVIVRRNIKRVKDSVRQDFGHIIINNSKMELTPSELKARILELLGYPKELLTKSKALIYRYTVYTHQEAMKQILFEEPEARLDVFRRIFHVDKYRRISQNTTILLQTINEKRKIITAQTSDLEERKQKTRLMEEKLKDVRITIASVLPLEREQEQAIAEKQRIISALEEKIKEHHELRSKTSSFAAKYEEKNRQLLQTQNETRRIEEEIRLTEKKLAASESALPVFLARTAALQSTLLALNEAPERKKELIEQLSALEKDYGEIYGMVREQERAIVQSEKAQNQVLALNNCPLCLQTVTEEHKSAIHQSEQEKIDAAKNALTKHLTLKTEHESSIKKVRLDLMKNEENEKQFTYLSHSLNSFLTLIEELHLTAELETYADVKARIDNDEIIMLANAAKGLKDIQYIRSTLADKKKINETLIEKQAVLKHELKEVDIHLGLLKEKIKLTEHTETAYLKARSEFNELLYKSREIASRKAAIQKEEEYLLRNLHEAEEDIAKKIKLKEELSSLHELNQWLSSYFIELMGTIEKHVMLKIHQEFNEIFQTWFGTLMEGEILTARLNEDFSPLITQDGHETQTEHLSGGEKTSCALAYRLALNKVINDMISGIKTKDLIILDEPTDGFSSEQLEKVREVLRQLNMQQIIIVSHEEKVESFVDSQIRIVKTEHISRVEG